MSNQPGSVQVRGPRTNRSPAGRPQRSTASKQASTPAVRRTTTSGAAKRVRTATVTLPFVTAEFRVPDVHVPSVHVPHLTLPSAHVPSVHLPSVHMPRPPVPHASGQDVTTAARVVGSYLPPREQLVLYAGMGAGAVAGLIEWPVAAAVAAGTYVAKRARSGGGPRPPAARKTTT